MMRRMSFSPRVRAALQRADDVAASPAAVRPGHEAAPRLDGLRPRVIACGDPQAPAAVVFDVLDRHGLLGEDGWLAADAHLVFLGDFLDWGGRDLRAAARRDGARVLAWSAVQDATAVTLVLGNHDLARVGELVGFDDARFAQAQREADAVYRTGSNNEHAFLARYPDVPSVECIARDFSSYSALQQDWVRALLRARRFVIAASHGDTLICHAGITVDELDGIGVPGDRQSDPRAVAEALQRSLHGACAAWDERRPLAIPVLHRPGDAEFGEGVGIFYHRPCQPDRDHEFPLDTPPPRRRFDARRLPAGVTQVIGHIRDGKCRTLLGDWCDDAPALDGPLRTLDVEGERVRYGRGAGARRPAGAARVVFTDGGLFHATPDEYEMYDLVHETAAPRG